MTRIPVLLAGLLLLGLSLPLALRKVPMNRYYGVRIPLAFKSERNWYEVNAYGGRQLAIGSLVVIAIGVAGFLIPRGWLRKYDFWAVLSLVTVVVVAAVRTILWGRRSGL